MCNYDDDDDDDDADDDNDIQVCVASDEHCREVAQLRLKDRQNLKNRLPTYLHSHQHCILVSRYSRCSRYSDIVDKVDIAINILYW